MSEGRLIHDQFSHLLGTTTHLSVKARVEYEMSIYACLSVKFHVDRPGNKAVTNYPTALSYKFCQVPPAEMRGRLSPHINLFPRVSDKTNISKTSFISFFY